MKAVIIVGAILVAVVVLVLLAHFVTRPEKVVDRRARELNDEAMSIFVSMLHPSSLTSSFDLVSDTTKGAIEEWRKKYKESITS